MKPLLLLGAILTELIVFVLLLGGLSYGITLTYSLGAAGYSRFGTIGAILAILFLWIIAWLPAILAFAVMIGLPKFWRNPYEGTSKKIGKTFAAVLVMFLISCFLGSVANLPLWIIGEGDCKASLQDVITWTWPCK